MKTLLHKLVMPCIAAALCAVATSAMAAVNNLESYLFRFDFSKGANEFSSSPSYADFNLVGANTADDCHIAFTGSREQRRRVQRGASEPVREPGCCDMHIQRQKQTPRAADVSG